MSFLGQRGSHVLEAERSAVWDIIVIRETFSEVGIGLQVHREIFPAPLMASGPRYVNGTRQRLMHTSS
jgi:hypothetical protein